MARLPKAGSRPVKTVGRCPYCQAPLREHCFHARCGWLQCRNSSCAAFGPPSHMVRLKESHG